MSADAPPPNRPHGRSPGRPVTRRNRTETIGASVSRLTKPIFGKRGLADGAVAREWGNIVGPMIARHSQPDRITYANRERTEGLLHLRVDHSALATELQHLEPQLLERINGYFGFKAVARMRFVHGPITAQQPDGDTPVRTPPPPASAAVARTVAAIDDPDLRAALQRLGDAVEHNAKRGAKRPT
ncbi:MAG: DUF721 domain-containing protein [Rhodospirillaceae bacterium]